MQKDNVQQKNRMHDFNWEVPELFITKHFLEETSFLFGIGCCAL